MSVLQKSGRALENWWHGLEQGWQNFLHKAGDALTHFRPSEDSAELGQGSLNWGVMPVSLSSNQGELVLELEAPGLEKDDIHVDIHEDYIAISGEKRINRELREGDCLRLERAYGCFQRNIALPVAVDASQTRASYDKGVLTVRMREQAAETGQRKISIG